MPQFIYSFIIFYDYLGWITENGTGTNVITHRGGVLCNEWLQNYICLLHVTLVLWTLLELSYLISIYIVVHCTYIRESVNIKKLFLLEVLIVRGMGCSLQLLCCSWRRGFKNTKCILLKFAPIMSAFCLLPSYFSKNYASEIDTSLTRE